MTRTQNSDAQPDFRAIIDELEQRIESLRHAYEKYFSGVDRVAPARMQQRVERSLRALEGRTPRSTALRFRLGGLRARFVTYKHYWTRVQLQIERGISRRERLRSLRGGAPKKPEDSVEAGGAELLPPPPPPAGAFAPPPSPTDAAKPPQESLAPPPTGTMHASPRPAPADPVSAGLDTKNLRDVFRSLVSAKRAAGESTKGLTYAALVRKLTREAPKLRTRHNCHTLRFEVSTAGGKVKVRSGPG